MDNKLLIDIVIVLGPNDINIIELNLFYNMKNISNARNIYIITPNNVINNIQPLIDKLNSNISYDIFSKDTISGSIKLIDEGIFPFKKDDVNSIMKNIGGRDGWYYQQILKLYSGEIIPDILENYLVIDADTLFVKPTFFLEYNILNNYKPDRSTDETEIIIGDKISEPSSNYKMLFSYGDEYNMPYFKHMEILHPCLIKQIRNQSGICHHMLFNKKYVKELIEMVENHHNANITHYKKPFWKIFIESAVKTRDNCQNSASSASEYEIYFNYMIYKHIDKIKIRKLEFTNCSRKIILNSHSFKPDSKYVYYSFHHYI
jgi:hypothetical protein